MNRRLPNQTNNYLGHRGRDLHLVIGKEHIFVRAVGRRFWRTYRSATLNDFCRRLFGALKLFF
jgi:hypothetical protein